MQLKQNSIDGRFASVSKAHVRMRVSVLRLPQKTKTSPRQERPLLKLEPSVANHGRGRSFKDEYKLKSNKICDAAREQKQNRVDGIQRRRVQNGIECSDKTRYINTMQFATDIAGEESMITEWVSFSCHVFKTSSCRFFYWREIEDGLYYRINDKKGNVSFYESLGSFFLREKSNH